MLEQDIETGDSCFYPWMRKSNSEEAGGELPEFIPDVAINSTQKKVLVIWLTQSVGQLFEGSCTTSNSITNFGPELCGITQPSYTMWCFTRFEAVNP